VVLCLSCLLSPTLKKQDQGDVAYPIAPLAILPAGVRENGLAGANEPWQVRRTYMVEMRFFTGLRAKEIAVVVKTTGAIVRRDWVIAKAWPYEYLERERTA
jgi:hypothetical protein